MIILTANPNCGGFFMIKTSNASIVAPESAAIVTGEVASEAVSFDYGAAAEMFSPMSRKARRQPLGYRRFARAAEAIRFAIEELSPQLLVGTYLEVAEHRYEGQQIRRLYESTGYPLDRRTALA
jgi:hypothetical protein